MKKRERRALRALAAAWEGWASRIAAAAKQWPEGTPQHHRYDAMQNMLDTCARQLRHALKKGAAPSEQAASEEP